MTETLDIFDLIAHYCCSKDCWGLYLSFEKLMPDQQSEFNFAVIRLTRQEAELAAPWFFQNREDWKASEAFWDGYATIFFDNRQDCMAAFQGTDGEVAALVFGPDGKIIGDNTEEFIPKQ